MRVLQEGTHPIQSIQSGDPERCGGQGGEGPNLVQNFGPWQPWLRQPEKLGIVTGLIRDGKRAATWGTSTPSPLAPSFGSFPLWDLQQGDQDGGGGFGSQRSMASPSLLMEQDLLERDLLLDLRE